MIAVQKLLEKREEQSKPTNITTTTTTKATDNLSSTNDVNDEDLNEFEERKVFILNFFCFFRKIKIK